MFNISKRLEAISSLVPFGARVCDIGTDHAYLSIYLAKTKKPKNIIALDLNEKPLKKAEENIKKYVACGISLRLSNGFQNVKKSESDTAVIAGRGAEVICDILKNGFRIVKDKEYTLILQPTTSPEILRRFLYENGFRIVKEIPIFENSKLYTIMLVKYICKAEKREEYFYYVGNLNKNDKTAKMYINFFICLFI